MPNYSSLHVFVYPLLLICHTYLLTYLYLYIYMLLCFSIYSFVCLSVCQTKCVDTWQVVDGIILFRGSNSHILAFRLPSHSLPFLPSHPPPSHSPSHPPSLPSSLPLPSLFPSLFLPLVYSLALPQHLNNVCM